MAADAAVVWGRRLRAGRGTRDTSSAPFGGTFSCAHPSVSTGAPSRGRLTGVRPPGEPVSLRVGRSAGLTGHRPVIQYREPPRGKAFFARGRFFWLCLSLFGGAGQAGQRQDRQGGVEGYAGVGGLGRTLGIVGLSIGGRVVVIAAGGGRGPHGIQRQRHF